MNRKPLHDNAHLVLEQRKIIQAGIENGSTKAAIALTIGKDATHCCQRDPDPSHVQSTQYI
jgi:hypothetical protein